MPRKPVDPRKRQIGRVSRSGENAGTFTLTKKETSKISRLPKIIETWFSTRKNNHIYRVVDRRKKRGTIADRKMP